MSVTSQDLFTMNLHHLRALRKDDVRHILSMQEHRHIFEMCDAFWMHSGDPREPHAELTSGLCSSGFIDTLRVLSYPNLCEIMAIQLAHLVRDFHAGNIAWVVGSDHASATLSFAVALELGARHDFTEKGPGKTQVWKRFTIEPEEVVLQVEELVTTTLTLEEVRKGVQKKHSELQPPYPVQFAPFSVALVHRSSKFEFGNGPILYPVHYDIMDWKPEECPLCKVGSPRLRPKENWAAFRKK